MTGLGDGNAARGIAAKHIPTPLGCEVIGVDGENRWSSIAQLHGVTDVSAVIHMQCGQRANLYCGIASLQVNLVFYVWGSLYILFLMRRRVEWQNQYAIRVA